MNGCFWHGHGCHLFRWPSTRPEFWRKKINGNVARDRRTHAALEEEGWRTCDVWECMLKGRHRRPPEEVIGACQDFLEGTETHVSIGGDQTVTVSERAWRINSRERA